MSTGIEVSAARDLALQKIGRNVVAFQKMEAMLKFLLKLANFTAPIAEGQEHMQKREKLYRTKPLGHLVEMAAKALHVDAQPPIPADIGAGWATYSISLGDGSQMQGWRKEFCRVVKERNALVHQMLADWNSESLESSRSLCDALDAQRDRFLSAYQHLESVVKAIHWSHQVLAQNADVIAAAIPNEHADGA